MSAGTLVLGGARSGKSAYAERLAAATGLAKRYIATAEPFDAEMRARIARHRADRAEAGWITFEAPLDLPAMLSELADAGNVVLVDCLTVWLGNLMHLGRDAEGAQSALLEAIGTARGPVILVSNEVGLGIVPETPLGRAFRDTQGRLNQAVAARMDNVVFVAAGLPLALKGVA